MSQHLLFVIYIHKNHGIKHPLYYPPTYLRSLTYICEENIRLKDTE